MWVNEPFFGATLYPGTGKKWNISTIMYYDFNQRKNNADIKVGDILTFSGGFGRSFLKGAANVGLAYGAQWKTTHPSGSMQHAAAGTTVAKSAGTTTLTVSRTGGGTGPR